MPFIKSGFTSKKWKQKLNCCKEKGWFVLRKVGSKEVMTDGDDDNDGLSDWWEQNDGNDLTGQFDHDNDGKIEVAELRYAMSKLGDVLEESTVDEMIAELDKEKTGFVDIQFWAAQVFKL